MQMNLRFPENLLGNTGLSNRLRKFLVKNKRGWTKEVGSHVELRGTLVHAKAIVIRYVHVPVARDEQT